MSVHVPILTEVVIRAWGLDDQRVLTHLRAENQPGHHRRTEILKDRAKDAGWSPLTLLERGKAATAAVRRLERVDFKWNGSNHHDQFLLSAYESRSHADDTPVSIFDE